MQSEYAILILAAGSSRRLGHEKQLVKFKGETLLNRTIIAAKSVKNTDCYVILGAHADSIFLQSIHSNYFINLEWEKGMAKTIAFGVHCIMAKKYKGYIFATCDQPFLTTAILEKLIRMHSKTKKGIVISKYKKGKGIPSFFSEKYVLELICLHGDDGAKSIVKNNYGDVSYINFQHGDFDIDTKESLQKLRRLESNLKKQ